MPKDLARVKPYRLIFKKKSVFCNYLASMPALAAQKPENGR